MISSESIKLFRLKNGLTQEKMAELLEISQSSYNRLENDKRELKISDIKIMAVNMNKDPNDLFKELCGEEVLKRDQLLLQEIKEQYEKIIQEKNAQIELLKSFYKKK